MYYKPRKIERYSGREKAKKLPFGNYCYHGEFMVELLLP